MSATIAVAGCGTLDSAETSTLPESLDACGDVDTPVAAFWGNDEGIGWPGRGPESPSGGDIWTITAEGSIRAVTDDARSRDPALSWDGERLYYNRSPGGVLGGAAAPGTEAWMLNLSTGESEKLFEVLDPEHESIGKLAESPDGASLAYSAAIGSPDAARERLYLISLDAPGSPKELLPPQYSLFDGQVEPAWSPDGNQLAYVYYQYDQENNSEWSIRIRDVASSAERVLYSAIKNARLSGLHWSPDGQAVLATEEAGSVGRTAILIDVFSGEWMDVAQVGLEATFLSADGSLIGAIQVPSNDLDAAGSEPALVTWEAMGENTEPTTIESFPVRFAFAADLAIATCALID